MSESSKDKTENDIKLEKKYTIVDVEDEDLTEFQLMVRNVMRKISPKPPTETELCDKASHHCYDLLYPKILEIIKENYEKNLANGDDRQLTILDIGVYRGGSIKMWREIFPDALIIGFDHNYNNVDKSLANEFNKDKKISFYKGDQSSVKLRDIMIENDYMFDLIIDDASHQLGPQMASFVRLRDRLKKGGMYLIEDIYPEYDYPDDFLELFDNVDLSYINDHGDDNVFIHVND